MKTGMWRYWLPIAVALVLFATQVPAQELTTDDVRLALEKFDAALSAKLFDDAEALLARDLVVTLTDCEAQENRMDLASFMAVFRGSFDQVMSYARSRAEVEVVMHENQNSGVVSSSLTETIVGEGFQVEGVSRDRIQVEARGDSVLIVKIESQSICP